MTYLNFARRAGETVTAAWPLAAVDNTGIAKVAQNSVKKLFRNVIRFFGSESATAVIAATVTRRAEIGCCA
jgi:hypothetical protein